MGFWLTLITESWTTRSAERYGRQGGDASHKRKKITGAGSGGRMALKNQVRGREKGDA